jgi:SAM-dependent methyltransferase
VARPAASDFAAFAALEREGWTRVAAGYADSFGRCTSLAIEPLLEAVRLTREARVLDVACGPGYAAAAAAARGVRACGLDFSAEMVARAAAACPGAEFRVGDAQALPWGEAEFDAVVSNFGVHHFPDPDRALAAMFRVLRSRGRMAFSAWDAPERSEAQRLLNLSIVKEGRLDVPEPPSPPAYRLSDAEEVRRTLTAIGFEDVKTGPVELRLTAKSAREVFEIFRTGTVRLGALLRYQTPEALERIAAEFEHVLEPWRNAEGVNVPMRAILSSGVKP